MYIVNRRATMIKVFLFHKEEDAKKLAEDYKQQENPVVAVSWRRQTVPGLYSSLFMIKCQQSERRFWRRERDPFS